MCLQGIYFPCHLKTCDHFVLVCHHARYATLFCLTLVPYGFVNPALIFCMPQGPRGILLQDPVIQYFKWNQEALDRVAVLCPDPVHRAEVVRQTVHNSKAKEEDVGCLLEQVDP